MKDLVEKVVIVDKSLCTKDLVEKVVSGASLVEVIEEAFARGKVEAIPTGKHILWDLYGGKPVFVRTVTHHYTGLLTNVADGFIVLEKCCWIADDGRFSSAMQKGTLKEVEPFILEDKVCVGIGAIVDISEWKHDLPTKQI
jgi:hypothetical protein